MPYRRTTAVQERLDAARAQVVAAAEALVRERGWAGCTVDAVAERAGVATGTVYRHVPDKGALLVEVFRAAASREVAAVAEAAAARPIGRGTEAVEPRVRRCVETFAGRAFRAPRLAHALLAEPADPAVEAERLVFRRAFADVFAALVADGVEAGALPEQEPALSAAAVVGALAEALVVPLHDQSESTAPTEVPDLSPFVIRALGGTP